MTDSFAVRREELLQIARRSRIKWVIDEKEPDHHDGKHGRPKTEGLTPSLKAKIPASESIQNVLNFLTDLINDGEVCDVASIAVGIIDYDDYTDEQYNNITHHKNGKPDSFNEFIGKLILPASTEIVKSMQQFVTKFTKEFQEANNKIITTTQDEEETVEPTEEELQTWSTKIWDFLDHTYETMRITPVWQHDTQQQFDITKQHTEKFIFLKLYPVLFASDYEDQVLNEKLYERIESLNFLTAEHLEIKCVRNLYEQYMKKNNLPIKEYLQASDYSFLNEILEHPIYYLHQIENFKTPQEKLLSIKRCTMAIASILKTCHSDNSLPGADELVPMMIYTIKTTNPYNLQSNLKYLQRYTRPTAMIGEAGYLLTNFISSVYFLNNVDSKALTIEPEEFNRSLLQSKMIAKKSNDNIIQQHKLLQQQQHSNSSNNNTSTTTNNNNNEKEIIQDIEKLVNNYKKEINNINKKEIITIQNIHKQRRSQYI